MHTFFLLSLFSLVSTPDSSRKPFCHWTWSSQLWQLTSKPSIHCMLLSIDRGVLIYALRLDSSLSNRWSITNKIWIQVKLPIILYIDNAIIRRSKPHLGTFNILDGCHSPFNHLYSSKSSSVMWVPSTLVNAISQLLEAEVHASNSSKKVGDKLLHLPSWQMIAPIHYLPWST